MKKNLFILILITSISIFYSCNRNTTSDHSNSANNDTANNKEAFGNGVNNNSPDNATSDDPFKNQPNNMCTVIRKLNVWQYDPENANDNTDLSKNPPKYCLLDVCLDAVSNPDLVINLGDSTENVNATFHCMKIFNSAQEAKDYAQKYGIVDIVIDE